MTRLIPDWEIRITNFGLGYILMCLVVAIAATNTGNNGLYLVLAAMLAAMIVSGMPLAPQRARRASARSRPSGEVVATRPAWLQGAAREPAPRPARRRPSSSCTSRCRARSGSIRSQPGEKREVVVEGVFPRRGVYREADAGLLSRFPLGLFRKYRKAAARAARSSSTRCPIAIPRPRSRRRTRAAGGRTRARGAAAPTSGRCASSRRATIPRDLHWKQSARMRRWIVREREAERDRVLFLAVDNALPVPADSARARALRERGRPLRRAGAPAPFARRRGRVPRARA